MANIIKTAWFGKQLKILLVNGKSVSGELTEVTDNYLILVRNGTEVQVMVSAIVMIMPAAAREQGQAQAAGSDSGPELFK